MRKRQLAVLLHRGEAKELAAEEEQGVEEDDGGVGPQLLTVPQVFLLHTGVDIAWRRTEEKPQKQVQEGKCVCVQDSEIKQNGAVKIKSEM